MTTSIVLLFVVLMHDAVGKNLSNCIDEEKWDTDNSIELRIDLMKRTYAPLEPVYAIIGLFNNTEKTLCVFEDWKKSVRLGYSERGKEFSLPHGIRPTMLSREKRCEEVPPRGHLNTLYYTYLRFPIDSFSLEGNHYIFAMITTCQMRKKSDYVSITIESNNDSLYDLINNELVKYQLPNALIRDDKTATLIHSFIASHPDSVYTYHIVNSIIVNANETLPLYLPDEDTMVRYRASINEKMPWLMDYNGRNIREGFVH